MFTGDRKMTKYFIQSFNLWYMANHGHPMMDTPMKRAVLALTYIQGPKTHNWVVAQTNLIYAKLMGIPPSPHPQALPEADGRFWTEFIDDFDAEYKDTSEAEDAFMELQQIT